MNQNDYIKQLNKVDRLKKSFDDSVKNPHLMKRNQELANMWLNHRKMNLSKRDKVRDEMLDKAKNEPPKVASANRFPIGNMYLFQYDAQTKLKLPYWDVFPLILPFSFKNGLMYGLNVHYMPREIRLKVLTGLQDSISGHNRMAPNVFVQRLAELSLFAPAIHAYYASNIKSNFEQIKPAEWENVIFLPVQKFVNDSKNGRKNVSLSKVYADYLKRI